MSYIDRTELSNPLFVCFVFQAHPTLMEQERKKLCRIVDCQQLSLDACMHAASNERLPLRVIVQVL
jgi:hypothetical protein